MDRLAAMETEMIRELRPQPARPDGSDRSRWRGACRAVCALAALLAPCVVAVPALAANVDVTWTFNISPHEIDVQVGDTVTFQFAGGHDVREFPDAAAYGSCNFSSASLLGSAGPIVVPFDTPGVFYFGCGVGAHCSAAGMYLQVPVAPGPPVPGVHPLLLAGALGSVGLGSAWLARRRESGAPLRR